MSTRTRVVAAPLLPEVFTRWFSARGWTPREHQLELLAKAQAGRSTLLIAPTGGGKTLAGFLPTLVELSPSALPNGKASRGLISAGRGVRRTGGLHTLYISPLKALAVDIARNLETPVAEMRLPIRIETRTGNGGTKTAEYWVVPAGATFDSTGTEAVDETTVKAVPDHPAAPKKKAAKKAAPKKKGAKKTAKGTEKAAEKTADATKDAAKKTAGAVK